MHHGEGRRTHLHRLVHQVVAVDRGVAAKALGDAPPDHGKMARVALLVEHPVLAGRVPSARRGVHVDDHLLPVRRRPRQNVRLENAEREVHVGVEVVVALPAALDVPVPAHLVAHQVGAPFFERGEVVLGDPLRVRGEHDPAMALRRHGAAAVGVANLVVAVHLRQQRPQVLGAKRGQVELHPARSLLEAKIQRAGLDATAQVAEHFKVLLPVALAVPDVGIAPAAPGVRERHHELEPQVRDRRLPDARPPCADREPHAMAIVRGKVEFRLGPGRLAPALRRQIRDKPVAVERNERRTEAPLDLAQRERRGLLRRAPVQLLRLRREGGLAGERRFGSESKDEEE